MIYPVLGIHLNGKVMSKRKYLTANEIDKILLATRQGKYHLRDYCLFKMCFVHGLRVSEARQLFLSDIDIPGRTIFIRRLKNSLSTQHPLFDDEIEAIINWKEQRNHLRGAESDWLFLSQKGGPLSRQHIRNLLKTYGAASGIRSHPHMLRHACGYALADRGNDTRLIQDYLGHKNIRHTVLYTATNARRFTTIWDCHQKKRDMLFAEEGKNTDG